LTVRPFRPHARRARLSVQPLEGRDVPNGTITASLSPTGVLTLTGDNDDNVVTLKVTTGLGANVVLTPDGATTIDDLANPAPPVGGAPVVLTGTVTSIKANLLGGADNLSADPDSAFSVSGAVAISLGDGNNTLKLDTTGSGGHPITLGGLSYTGGDGTDDVTVSGGPGSTVAGTTKVTVANGGGTTTLGGVRFTAVNYKATEAAGATPNVVTGTNVTVTGLFQAALGNSNPAVLDFTGSTLGTLKASGNSYISTLTTTTVNTSVGYKAVFGAALFADGLTATGGVSVTAPNASFFAIPLLPPPAVGGGRGAVVGGNLAVSGSAATTVSFESTTLSEVKGTITVKGGFGNDLFETNANFRADKAVNLTLNGGDNTVTVGDGTGALALGGAVTIKAGDGSDTVAFDQVTVTGAVSVATKGGADLLSIEDGSRFVSTFTADLGLGDDTISVAQNPSPPPPATPPGPVTFTGHVKILAGVGNDTLFLGVGGDGDTTTSVVFTDPTSTIDGGLDGGHPLNSYDPATADTSPVVLLNWS